MDKPELLKMLSENRLFSGADASALGRAVDASFEKTFSRGDQISWDEPCLYYVISGKAVVRRPEGGQSVILNVLTQGDVFGAARLFGDEGELTSVIASERCVCLLIPLNAVEDMMKSDFTFTVNYIRFLSDRVSFLNRRIAAITVGDGEKTLAFYLLARCSGDGEKVPLSLNMTKLAGALNISRPTLYRAVSSLSDSGIIERSGSEITVLSYEKLKNV